MEPTFLHLGFPVNNSANAFKIVGRSTSSSDNKGSSVVACTATSSGKDIEEESSLDIELDLTFNLGCEKLHSLKKPVDSNMKALELQPSLIWNRAFPPSPREMSPTNSTLQKEPTESFSDGFGW
ncbi:unnamed protein product [Lathyrus sativus]|nr:unnamed protein product [Lathyrus sativus]